MKNFFCYLLITGMIFISACQNPLDEIDKVQTHIEDDDILNEQVFLSEDESKSELDAQKKDNRYAECKVEQKEDYQKENVNQRDNKSNTMDNESIFVTVYYQDEKGTLVPVTRNIGNREGIAKASITSMIDSDNNRKTLKLIGLKPVLPKGTEVLGINLEDGLAVIDFNSKLLDYNTKQEEHNIFAGIVYSLTEFKTISSVRILVNGYNIEELEYSGKIMNAMTRDNTLINSEKLNIDNKTMKLDIYLFKYLDDNHEYLIPVSKEYIGITKDMLPIQMVSALSKQPQNDNLYTQIPENVELLSSSIADKVLTLDFSRDIKNYGGNEREAGLIRQILYTMKQINGVEKVKIIIEGKQDFLPEGTDISKALLLPEKINKIAF